MAGLDIAIFACYSRYCCGGYHTEPALFISLVRRSTHRLLIVCGQLRAGVDSTQRRPTLFQEPLKEGL